MYAGTPAVPIQIGALKNDENTVRLPRQDLPGMMKSLKSSHNPRF